jgi:hypothetical protein
MYDAEGTMIHIILRCLKTLEITNQCSSVFIYQLAMMVFTTKEALE